MKDVEIIKSSINLNWQPNKNGYVIIVGFDSNMDFIMIQHSAPDRFWELPGGKIETDENILDTATREFSEETGYELNVPVIVAEIHNYYSDKKFHSCAWLVAGIVISNTNDLFRNDLEVINCKAFDKMPRKTSFSKKWYQLLIDKSHFAMENHLNKTLWESNSKEYSTSTTISFDEVHYGPLIPGENTLKLLPNLDNKRVLDLGCGQGHNLMAMKKLGAKNGVGIDFSPHNVMIATQLLCASNYEVFLDNYLNISSKKLGQFDVIISIFSISFIRDLNSFFNLVSSLSKQDTIIVFSTDHPNRVGYWRHNHLEIDNYFKNRNKARVWQIDNNSEYSYFHYTHSFESIVEALVKSNFSITNLIEPPAMPKRRLKFAPYVSNYFKDRYSELSSTPYTLIIKAKYQGLATNNNKYA